MTYARLRLAVSALSCLFLAGCVPSNMPAFIDGGKTIVALAIDAHGELALWKYDVETKNAAAYKPADGWKMFSARSPGARMLGDQIWVSCYKETGPGNANEETCKRFDPVKNEFVAGPAETQTARWLRNAIPASHDGSGCLFLTKDVPPGLDGKRSYTVFTFPDLKSIGSVNLGTVFTAGNGWWVTLGEGVDVFNTEGKQAVTVPAEEFKKIGKWQGIPYARVDERSKTLFLACETDQGGMDFTYGLFDLTNGKFLWGGATKDAVHGTPVFSQKEIWSLQGQRKEPEIRLVRHTQGDIANESRQEVVLKYSLTVGQRTGDYSPFPDQSRFVLVVDGKPSRLLFIPLKAGVTDKDVEVVELTAEKDAAK